MPKATVSLETQRFDLKTLPESREGAGDGGFVELRTLSFHEMNTRMDMAARMYQEQKVNPKGKQAPPQDEIRAYLEVMNVAVTEYEFRNCIVSHNLFMDDEETQLIDFTKPMQTWRLDPKIGEEISTLISKLTQTGDDELVPLGMPLSSSSSDEQTTTDSEPSLATA